MLRSIPRPAGFELIEKPVIENGLAAFEEHKDAFHFFIEKWHPGKHSLNLKLKPGFASQEDMKKAKYLFVRHGFSTYNHLSAEIASFRAF